MTKHLRFALAAFAALGLALVGCETDDTTDTNDLDDTTVEDTTDDGMDEDLDDGMDEDLDDDTADE